MARIKQNIYLTLCILMTLAVSANMVLAQEEAEAVEASGSSLGLTIALFGAGALVILGLGFAMNIQQSKEDEELV